MAGYRDTADGGLRQARILTDMCVCGKGPDV